jgi:RNA polymerase sigma-70 factor (sigma-E family)
VVEGVAVDVGDEGSVRPVPGPDRIVAAPDEAPGGARGATGRRDTAGFDEWYAVSFDGLVRLAYLLVGSPDVARDLTQDAMVRVLARWRSIDHPDHYARRAVVNACNSHHRRRAVMRRHPQPEPGSYELEASELTDALARLPHRQRAALVLRYWSDLPEAEIAAALGVTRNTVASLLRRGHERLRELIKDE